MVDRPIIFSGPMVRALIEGRKTQTRRIIKPYEAVPHPFHSKKPVLANLIQIRMPARNGGWIAGPSFNLGYATGDRLYVREAHSLVPSSAYRCSPGVSYAVNPDDPDRACVYREGWERSAPRWRPSIHMPRWASRLTLTVTDVRVQRLQDISNDDAIAEGIKPHGHAFTGYGKQADVWMAPYDSFASLWNSLHGPDAWDANPWVVALTFTVEQRNIDAGGENG